MAFIRALALWLLLPLQVLLGDVFREVYPSMGTFFSVKAFHKGTVATDILSRSLLDKLDLYEHTFSGWEDSSELRQIEKKDLTQWQTPSSLFMQILVLSLDLFHQTKGFFDITVGRYQWAGLQPIGMDQLILSDDQTSFRFKTHPERLSFDGMLKGYVVGLLAQMLYKAGFSSFSIDAGGGDMAFFVDEKILFQCFSGKNHNRNPLEQHVFSPTGEDLKLGSDFAKHELEGGTKDYLLWPRMGAYCDAFATAKILGYEKEVIQKISDFATLES